ncbi:MAG: hypothetical protein N2C14_07235 [Planctomycetales bacterium]
MTNAYSLNSVLSVVRAQNDQVAKKPARQHPETLAKVPAKTSPKKKKSRRRLIDPTTCERDYSNDEVEFMRALDDYKRRNGRMFPTCSEILEVIRGLGYCRLSAEEIRELNDMEEATGGEATDCVEEADALDEVDELEFDHEA